MTDETNNNEEQQEGSLDRRKRLFPDYKKNRQRANKGRFAGLNDDQIRQKIAEEDAKRAKDAEEERLDQDPELNKQREDMKQGDFLQDPEFEFNETTDIRNSKGLYEQDNADKGFSAESIGRSIQAILSIPDMIDKRAV